MKFKHLTLVIISLLLIETISPVYLAVEANHATTEETTKTDNDDMAENESEDISTEESIINNIEENSTIEENINEMETTNSTDDPTIEDSQEIERAIGNDTNGIIKTNQSELPWRLEDGETLFLSQGQLNGFEAAGFFRLSEELHKDVVEQTKTIVLEGEILLNQGMGGLFSNFPNLIQIINIENLNGINMTSSQYMFKNTTNLTQIDWSNKYLSFYNMKSMFQDSNVEIVDFTNTTFPNTVSMQYLFQNCQNLSLLKIDGLSAPRLTNIEYFIHTTPKITNLNLENNSLYLPTMKNMFSYSNIETANLNRLNLPITTSLENLFNNASSLHSITMDGIEGHKVVNTNSMFLGQTSLTQVDWSNHTINLKSLASMFSSSRIETVNLDNLSLPITTDMSKLFAYSNLSSITMNNLKGQSLTNTADIFMSTKNLNHIDWSNHKLLIKNANKFFSNSSLQTINLTNFQLPIATSTQYLFGYNNQLTAVEIDNFTAPVSTNNYYWFASTNIKHIDWSHKTLNISSMRNMFYLSKLESVNLDYIQLPLTTNFDLMFSKVSSIRLISMNHIYAPKLSTTNSMFKDANNLVTLDISFEPEVTLTNAGNMFNGASSLEAIDISTINIEKTLNVVDMFANTSSLRALTLGDNTVLERSVSLPEAARDSGGNTLEGFTGLWQTIGTGSVEEPNGKWSGTSNQLVTKSKEKKKETYVWGIPPKVIGAGEIELLHFPSSFDFGINNTMVTNDKLVETKSKEHIVVRELRGMTSETNAGNWKLSASAEQLTNKKNTQKLDSSVSYLFTTTLKQYENEDDSLPPSEDLIFPPSLEQKESVSLSRDIDLPTDGFTVDIMKATNSPDGRYALELEKTQLKIPKDVKTDRTTYNGNITWILADTI